MKCVSASFVAAGLMICGQACFAHSNDVFSSVTTPSTPLTGYRIAAVSVTPIWVFGSPPRLFGIEECSYWTDSAGRTILWPASRVRAAGDMHHRYTRLRLGAVSFSVPLPPTVMAVVTGIVVLAFGTILIWRFTKVRTQHNEESIKA